MALVSAQWRLQSGAERETVSKVRNRLATHAGLVLASQLFRATLSSHSALWRLVGKRSGVLDPAGQRGKD